MIGGPVTVLNIEQWDNWFPDNTYSPSAKITYIPAPGEPIVSYYERCPKRVPKDEVHQWRLLLMAGMLKVIAENIKEIPLPASEEMASFRQYMEEVNRDIPDHITYDEWAEAKAKRERHYE